MRGRKKSISRLSVCCRLKMNFSSFSISDSRTNKLVFFASCENHRYMEGRCPQLPCALTPPSARSEICNQAWLCVKCWKEWWRYWYCIAIENSHVYVTEITANTNWLILDEWENTALIFYPWLLVAVGSNKHELLGFEPVAIGQVSNLKLRYFEKMLPAWAREGKYEKNGWK